jgi:hypothetical protein
MYTTIIAVNTQNDGQEPAYETILLGASSNLYVSPDNIYLTFPIWGTGMGDVDKTSIHRIHIEGSEIEPVASGEVPGTLLNQFSMDEYEVTSGWPPQPVPKHQEQCICPGYGPQHYGLSWKASLPGKPSIQPGSWVREAIW